MATRHLEIKRHDDYAHAVWFVVADPAGDYALDANGVPVAQVDGGYSLVPKPGYSYRAMIRHRANDTTAISFTADETLLDPDALLILRLDPTLTADSLIGVWDLEETAPGGVVTTILEGNVVISDDVTYS